VKRNCKVCGKEFEFKRSRLNYGKYTNEFCSVICKGIAKSIPKVERVCEFCKSTFFVQRSALKNNPSRFCSHKCADTHNRGWNNVKFKDASSEAEKLRKSPAYINWRTTVFIRDGKKCVFCGSKKDIEADHIKPRYLFPELTLELTNGRTLCHDCHSKTPTYMNGYMKREDFVEV
jgi:5-methylcytosine-specific restriction endonuclease McrA